MSGLDRDGNVKATFSGVISLRAESTTIFISVTRFPALLLSVT